MIESHFITERHIAVLTRAGSPSGVGSGFWSLEIGLVLNQDSLQRGEENSQTFLKKWFI